MYEMVNKITLNHLGLKFAFSMQHSHGIVRSYYEAVAHTGYWPVGIKIDC